MKTNLKRLKLAKLIQLVSDITTDKGTLTLEGELEVGAEVFMVDSEGQLVPAADGEYETSDLFIVVSENAEIDRRIKYINLADDIEPMVKFNPGIGLEAEPDRIRIQISLLGENGMEKWNKILGHFNPDEDFPVVPYPSLDPFRTDSIIKEYKELFNTKFLYYYCFKLDEYCLQCLNQGNFASVDMTKFNNFRFPLIPIEEQERIVSILDRFDKLCNDISEGIPAEIEARQKQYEYYRDKLLTFKEKVNG